MSQTLSASSVFLCLRFLSFQHSIFLRISFALVVCLFCRDVALGQSQAPATGTITATVLDSQGNPLNGLTVMLRSIGQQSPQTRKNVTTDANGHLVVTGCSFGTYLLVAVHNETPTLAMNPTIRGNSVVTTVLLSQSFSTAMLTMKFGSEMSVISGKLKDAVTGKPVAAQLAIKSASGQSWFSGGIPPSYQVIVPRLTDLSVQISAPGYRTWYYPGATVQSDTRPLNQPISNKQLDIVLKPAN